MVPRTLSFRLVASGEPLLSNLEKLMKKTIWLVQTLQKQDWFAASSPRRRSQNALRRSPLRGLHHILELQKAVVRRQCVLGVHLREQVVRDRGAPHELGHRPM